MREIRPPGSMSGEWKRSTSYRATPRLSFFCDVPFCCGGGTLRRRSRGRSVVEQPSTAAGAERMEGRPCGENGRSGPYREVVWSNAFATLGTGVTSDTRPRVSLPACRATLAIATPSSREDLPSTTGRRVPRQSSRASASGLCRGMTSVSCGPRVETQDPERFRRFRLGSHQEPATRIPAGASFAGEDDMHRVAQLLRLVRRGTYRCGPHADR